MEEVFSLISLKEMFYLILTSIALSLGSFFIIRLSGKKSVSQMTLPQTVIMLSLGSLIVAPINQHRTIIGALIGVFIFVLVMLLLEWLCTFNNQIETFIESRPILLVIDGRILYDNLQKVRLTVDQLESFLRVKGISSFQDLRTCTLEINGDIGFEKMNTCNSNKKNIFDELRKQNHNFNIDENVD